MNALTAVIVTTGGAIGFLLGWRLAPSGAPEFESRVGDAVVSGVDRNEAGTEPMPHTIEDIVGGIHVVLGNLPSGEVMLEAWRRVELMSLAELHDAAAWLHGRKRDSSEQSILGMIMERWATLDPEGFLNDGVAMDPYDSSGVGRMKGVAFRQLVFEDPDKVIEQFKKLKSRQSRNYAGEIIAGELARQDPELLLAFAKLAPGTRSRYEQTAFANLAQSDPRRAAELASKSLGQARNLTSILSTWAQSDPDSALAWLAKHVASEGESSDISPEIGRLNIAKGLAKTDPMRALEIADGLNSSLRADVYSNIAESLAERDPEAAKSVVATLPPGRKRANSIGQISSAMAKTAPEKTIEWARNLTNPAERTEALRTMLWKLHASDPVLALEAIDAIPGSGARDTAFQRFLKSYPSNDPHALMNWARDLEDKRRSHLAISEAFRKWSPEQSERYLASVPDESEREALMRIRRQVH